MFRSSLTDIFCYFLSEYLPTAAAVLELGELQQSPIAKILEYLTCCSVSLSTSTNPASFDSSLLFLMQSDVDIGGVTCSKEY